jgi:tetratricopeptide (TPR) repeat protein
MTKSLLVFILLLLPVFLFSQQEKTDSLLAAIRHVKHDTERVKILYELIEAISGSEWEGYNDQLKELAGKNSRALPAKHPLKKFYLNYYARALSNSGVIAYEKGNSAASLPYFRESMQIQEEIKDSTGACITAYNMASSYLALGNAPVAMDCIEKSLTLSTDKDKKALCLNSLGIISEKTGDIPAALDYHHQSLKLREELADKKGIANSFNNIGIIYFNQGDISAALDYFTKSLKIREELNEKREVANSLHNISTIFSLKGELQKAMEYSRKALKIQEETGDLKNVAASLDNIGVLYGKEGNLAMTMEYAQKGLAIQEKISDKGGMSSSLYIIGNVYNKQGQIAKAIPYLQKSLQLSQETGFPTKIRDAAELLKDLYKKQGNDAAALKMYELFIRMRDSVLNEETKKAALQKQYQYAYEKKEEALKKAQEKKEWMARAEQEKKEALQKKESRQKTYLVYGLSLIALLAVAVAFLFVRQHRLRARQQNLELEQKLLRSQMNPHFIFNVLNSIQSYIYKKDSINAGNFLSRFADLTRMILENSRENYISLEKEIAGLNNYLELQQLRFEDNFDYSIETAPGIDPAIIAIPPMLAQPFIENALEHGIPETEKGHIRIRFSLRETVLVMEIEDDGIGIENAKATKQSAHRSLATTITAERLVLLNRQSSEKIRMEVTEPEPGDRRRPGTKVVFHIPYTLV